MYGSSFITSSRVLFMILAQEFLGGLFSFYFSLLSLFSFLSFFVSPMGIGYFADDMERVVDLRDIG